MNNVPSYTIDLYRTPLDRSQRNVSSNTRRLLDRLRDLYGQDVHAGVISVPAFQLRERVSLTIDQNDLALQDDRFPDYAVVHQPSSPDVAVAMPFGDLYYFIEIDDQSTYATYGSTNVTLVLDAWATLTSQATAREAGDELIRVDGRLVQGHSATLHRGGGALLTTPSREVESVRTVDVEGCRVAAVYRLKSGRMAILTFLNGDRSGAGNPFTTSAEVAVYGELMAQPVGLYLQVGELDTENPTVFKPHTTEMIESIVGVYAIPNYVWGFDDSGEGLWGTGYQYGQIVRNESDTANVGLHGAAMLSTDTGAYRQAVRMFRRGRTVNGEGQVNTVPYLFGNQTHGIELTCMVGLTRICTEVVLDAGTGQIMTYLTVNGRKEEITESTRLSYSAYASASERIQNQTKDALSMVGSGMTIAGGVATGNIGAIAGGVIGMTSTIADARSRTRSMQTETGQQGATAVSYVVGGFVRSETFTGTNGVIALGVDNQDAIDAEYKQYGLSGAYDATNMRISVPNTFTYVRMEDVDPREPSRLAEMVSRLIEQGIRIWNDEDTNRYKNFALTPREV